jgi:hypothetical protein
VQVVGSGVLAPDRGAFPRRGIYNECGVTDAAARLLTLEGAAEAARAETRRVWPAGRTAS